MLWLLCLRLFNVEVWRGSDSGVISAVASPAVCVEPKRGASDSSSVGLRGLLNHKSYRV